MCVLLKTATGESETQFRFPGTAIGTPQSWTFPNVSRGRNPTASNLLDRSPISLLGTLIFLGSVFFPRQYWRRIILHSIVRALTKATNTGKYKAITVRIAFVNQNCSRKLAKKWQSGNESRYLWAWYSYSETYRAGFAVAGLQGTWEKVL